MNYMRLYNNLITIAMNRKIRDDIIYEKHHIIPKSLGGSNLSINLVKLTLREHYLAHVLLYKIHINDRISAGKMISALNRMTKSRRYKLTSRQYEYMRMNFLLNMPMKTDKVRQKIRKATISNLIARGYIPILCNCGCGEIVKHANPDKMDMPILYINGHRIGNTCLCGCGKNTGSLTRKRLIGHNIKIKCACGCGRDTSVLYDCSQSHRIVYYREHHPSQNCLNPNTKIKISNSIKTYIGTLSDEEKKERLQKSFSPYGPMTDEKILSIKKSKASKLLMITSDNSHIEFYSYDDVSAITGYSYPQIRYIIQRKNGIMDNGSIISYIERYTTNDKRRKDYNNTRTCLTSESE